MAFTEFCCRSGGNNLNAGTRKGDTVEPGLVADLTYVNGTWTNATKTFTVASGNPVTDGITANDFVALDTTGGVPPATYGGRVASVTATTIVLGAAVWGTIPANGTYTLRVGGAWAGPGGAVLFPFNVLAASAANAAADQVRLNVKNDQIYNMTATLTSAGSGPVPNVHGYANSYGDGGKTTIDGGTTGVSFYLLNWAGGSPWIDSFIFAHNGITTPSNGVNAGGLGGIFTRCVITGMAANGVVTSQPTIFKECEFYGNNTGGIANNCGIVMNNSTIVDSCIIHDNLGVSTHGIRTASNQVLHVVKTVFANNGGSGIDYGGAPGVIIDGCDFYNNSGSGLSGTNGGRSWIMNSNFLKNGVYGIGSLNFTGYVFNCGFGSGSMANTPGAIQSTRAVEAGRITYPPGITPWVNPATGDFRISLAAAKGTGRGAYTQTAPGFFGTVAYPDVAAAQHQEGAVFFSF